MHGTKIPQLLGWYASRLAFGHAIFAKTVLTRIISIVRVPSLFPNKGNTCNRDDDAKRSPLSVKRASGFVFTGKTPGAIEERSSTSFSGVEEGENAFRVVVFLLSSVNKKAQDKGSSDGIVKDF